MKKYAITAAAILLLAVAMISPAFAEEGGNHSAMMKAAKQQMT